MNPNLLPKTAALYARVSTKGQADNYSLPSQLRAMREYAIEKGYRILPRFEYIEIGHLGDTLDRPELTKLRRAVLRGEVEVIVCYEVDRFTRNADHLALLKEEFQQCDASLEFVLREEPHSVFFAEYEIAALSERSSRGQEERALRGLLPGSKPAYGYMRFVDPESSQTEFLINEKEAAVVRQIFDYATNDCLTLSEIAERLNRKAVPTYTGVPWSRGVVQTVLNNPVYIGKFIYRRSRRSLHNLPNDVIEIPVPVIVDPAQFELARRQQEINKKTRTGRPAKAKLSPGLTPGATDSLNQTEGEIQHGRS